MNQKSTPVDSVESFLTNLEQAFTACKSPESDSTMLTNSIWFTMRSLGQTESGPLSLTTEYCKKIHELCISYMNALEKESLKQSALGNIFVILVEAFSTVLNYLVKSNKESDDLAKSTFKDYVKCLSQAVFFADFLSSLSNVIKYMSSKKREAENGGSDNNEQNLTIDSVLSEYMQTMIQSVKKLDPTSREEAKPALEYIWATLIMQAVPLYLYVAKECMPLFLTLCTDAYITSMFNWVIEYAEKIIKAKDGNTYVQYCGKHCSMIYNFSSPDLKSKLIPCLEKSLENELVFYNICQYLIPEEEINPLLRKQYDALADRLADKLLGIAKEIKGATNEDQQLKGLTIANIYIVGLKFFGPKNDPRHAVAFKAINAIKILRIVPLKMKGAIPSAEFIRNMLDLHKSLQGVLEFKDYYCYLRLCKQFVVQKKFLLMAALIIIEYIAIDPLPDYQTEVF